jgi:DNA-binding transcriptional MerR regulator
MSLATTRTEIDRIANTDGADGALNINEASKSCGLSPSVLRIWEARYGWPQPQRRPNGYRVYAKDQVADLQRVADLVRCGMPISTILIDGQPKWPAELVRPPKPRATPRARMLPPPTDRMAAQLQREVLDALETGRGSLAMGVLQRAGITIRPAQEPLAVLVPLLIGLYELRQNERSPAEDVQLEAALATRAQQLLRQFRPAGAPVLIVPASLQDHALAAVTALMLAQQGINAQPWLQPSRPNREQLAHGWIRAGAHFQPPGAAKPKASVSVLGDEDGLGLAEIVEGQRPDGI